MRVWRYHETLTGASRLPNSSDVKNYLSGVPGDVSETHFLLYSPRLQDDFVAVYRKPEIRHVAEDFFFELKSIHLDIENIIELLPWTRPDGIFHPHHLD